MKYSKSEDVAVWKPTNAANNLIDLIGINHNISEFFFNQRNMSTREMMKCYFVNIHGVDYRVSHSTVN